MGRLIVVLILLNTSLVACADEPKYYRADCIVRLNIDWSGVHSSQFDLSEDILNAILKAPKMGFNEAPPSSAVHGRLNQYWYLQYTNDCENRLHNTEKLIQHVRESVRILPLIEIDEGVFQPGPATIRVSGRWWIDHDDSPVTNARSN